MKPIFFKELKSYTIEYLSKKLEIDNEYMDELIKNLIERKLISKNKDKTISFKYVGIIIYNEKVLFIFPKYIDKNDIKRNELAQKAQEIIKIKITANILMLMKVHFKTQIDNLCLCKKSSNF